MDLHELIKQGCAGTTNNITQSNKKTKPLSMFEKILINNRVDKHINWLLSKQKEK